MRVRPWKGKFVFRATANRINDMLLSAPKPDRTAAEKEAQEFIELIKERRSRGRQNNGSTMNEVVDEEKQYQNAPRKEEEQADDYIIKELFAEIVSRLDKMTIFEFAELLKQTDDSNEKEIYLVVLNTILQQRQRHIKANKF